MKMIGGRVLEHWERWVPTNGIPSRLYNDTFIDNKEGIVLEFSDEKDKKKMVVKFEKGVLSYRNTDEGSLLRKLNYLEQQYGSDFYSEWTLFKVINSDKERNR
ncbi:hypothetical protein ABC1196 [Shouchella clausii KSM-K16]|uniref:Uncharacterized protein n=1 Tax=Shouchella clausii (strain KSM-K16) TaxID=66692 RepID=Q5WIS1_SHOC1|nr:hypothetical protein ABC1196 [Shouchella clausii KSM-K16]